MRRLDFEPSLDCYCGSLLGPQLQQQMVSSSLHLIFFPLNTHLVSFRVLLERLKVRVGTLLRLHDVNIYSLDMVEVYLEYQNHENYDIAMLRVNETIQFNEFVTYIEVPILDSLGRGDTVRLAGWVISYGMFFECGTNTHMFHTKISTYLGWINNMLINWS